MRIESSPFDPVPVPVPIREPGSEAVQTEDRSKQEKTPESDYMYALSVGSLINVQV